MVACKTWRYDGRSMAYGYMSTGVFDQLIRGMSLVGRLHVGLDTFTYYVVLVSMKKWLRWSHSKRDSDWRTRVQYRHHGCPSPAESRLDTACSYL